MKLAKKECGLPPELCTVAARKAFDYAGEDPHNAHVRWLGTNDEPATPFTRHDFEDLFGVVEHVTGDEYGDDEGSSYRVHTFQALGKLKDGRIALVEAYSRGGWASSNGVAKVTNLIIEMGDYLARSERLVADPVHRGRVKLCGALRLRLETATIREVSAMADAAFDAVEKTVG